MCTSNSLSRQYFRDSPDKVCKLSVCFITKESQVQYTFIIDELQHRTHKYISCHAGSSWRLLRLLQHARRLPWRPAADQAASGVPCSGAGFCRGKEALFVNPEDWLGLLLRVGGEGDVNFASGGNKVQGRILSFIWPKKTCRESPETLRGVTELYSY